MNRNDFKSHQETVTNQPDLFRNQASTSSNEVALLIDFESSDTQDLSMRNGDVNENKENVQKESIPLEEIEDFEADFDRFFKKYPDISIQMTGDSDKTDDFEKMSSEKSESEKFPGGLFAVDFSTIPDVNIYQHKKTVAQGMMDLALFSANANQLRYIFENPNNFYYYPGISLILTSLIFQVLVGIGLILNTRYNVKNKKEICLANKINNFTIIGIFLITIINVFISAFGVAADNNTNLDSTEVPIPLNNTQ